MSSAIECFSIPLYLHFMSRSHQRIVSFADQISMIWIWLQEIFHSLSSSSLFFEVNVGGLSKNVKFPYIKGRKTWGH